MPRAKVSVANTALTKPRWKRSSIAFLNDGRRPAWCAATPRSNAVIQSRYPSTSKSSSAKLAVYLSAVFKISARSSVFVNFIPAAKHCLTAASHPMREKMKVIAGKRFSRCSFSIISGRESLDSCTPHCSRRCRGTFALRIASRSAAIISGLTLPGEEKRSINEELIRICW